MGAGSATLESFVKWWEPVYLRKARRGPWLWKYQRYIEIDISP